MSVIVPFGAPVEPRSRAKSTGRRSKLPAGSKEGPRAPASVSTSGIRLYSLDETMMCFRRGSRSTKARIAAATAPTRSVHSATVPEHVFIVAVLRSVLTAIGDDART